MKIDQSLAAPSLAPALRNFWQLSGQKIDLILKEYDPAQGSPVFTAAGKYTTRGWTEWTQGFQFGMAFLQYDATGDEQWIHVDVERAKAGPFGAPIAHGFLTLSLIPRFFESALEIRNTRMGVNYGLNRVRFTAPVPAGSRLRATMKLLECQDLPDNGMQMTWLVTVEREGGGKPVCIAESLTRRYA